MENLSNNPFRKSNKLVKIFDDYGKSVKRLSLVLDFEKNNKFEILYDFFEKYNMCGICGIYRFFTGRRQ